MRWSECIRSVFSLDIFEVGWKFSFSNTHNIDCLSKGRVKEAKKIRQQKKLNTFQAEPYKTIAFWINYYHIICDVVLNKIIFIISFYCISYGRNQCRFYSTLPHYLPFIGPNHYCISCLFHAFQFLAHHTDSQMIICWMGAALWFSKILHFHSVSQKHLNVSYLHRFFPLSCSIFHSRTWFVPFLSSLLFRSKSLSYAKVVPHKIKSRSLLSASDQIKCNREYSPR